MMDKQADGLWSVPMKRWKQNCHNTGIVSKEIRWDIALETLPIPIRGLRGGALILIKP